MEISPYLSIGRVKPVVSSFNVLSLPGLQGWYKADRGVYLPGAGDAAQNNDPVGTWQDQSGNANHIVQVTTANQPTLKTNRINGKPTIYFTVDDYLIAESMFMAAPTAWTIYVVKVSRLGSGGTIVGAFSFDVIGGWQYATDGRMASVSDGIGSKTWTTAGLAEPVWRYFTSKFDGTNMPIRVNGTQSGSQSNTGSYTGFSPTIPVSVGALVDGSLFPPSVVYPLEGEIAELIMCNVSHSAGNISATESYLASEYAL